MSLALKPTHATVKAYYETLGQFGQLHIDHEMAVRSAFQDLLAKSGRKAKPPLTLVPEYLIERARGSVRVDGALVDLYHLPHGYWEAKDEKDDLAKEASRRFCKRSSAGRSATKASTSSTPSSAPATSLSA